jgi:transposase, IS6 family
MLFTPSISGLFKWLQFEPEVILLAVGWYLRFSLSDREVEELLAERGLWVDHVTVWRSRPALRPGVAAAFTPAPQAD